jgi:folate-dependent phosphoribosylglycinamide formyltransferase PurN
MSTDPRPRIVLLAGREESSNIVFHALAKVADVVAVIQEDPPSKVKMAKRRMKRVGLLPVADQVLFITLAARILKRRSASRVATIHAQSGMDATPIPSQVVQRVSSVNDRSVIEALRVRQPDVVVVNGTRIIGKRVLECVEAPFVNTHTGITPAYRGVHGGYWALAEGKPELAGVTVHYVDAGIDTGAVIGQALIHPGPEDSFHTYPTLQLAAGLPLLEKAVLDTHRHGVQTKEPLTTASRLYYHPGLTQYLFHRLLDGVR